MRPDFTIGLDLGQAQDFTALAVLERQVLRDADGAEERVYALRHLQRYPLGTAYTEIVPAVAKLASTPQLRGSPLVVDQTGVGRALVDMLRRAGIPGAVVPVTITGGQQVTQDPDGSWHVPKKELVTCLQLLLQDRRLKLARGLPDADTLVRELQQFQVKITAAAHEVFGTWRDGQHDDLVLAVALAAWWVERHPPWGPGDGVVRGRTVVDDAPPWVFG